MAQLLSSGLHVGQNTPFLLYGTAWKEDTTSELTTTALKQGFKGVDSANYPTAYNEPLVGDGLATALSSGLKRDDLFIQSKFGPAYMHRPDKIPYDTDQSIEAQVKQSIQQSFDNLKVEYLDSLLLHAPYLDNADGITAWQVLETYVPDKIRHIGVSNVTLEQLQHIYEDATVKPVIVQNKFFKETRFDLEVRAFCKDRGILYQAFGMLTHNPEVLASEVVGSVAKKYGVDREVAFYVLILCLGDTQVLNGTTKEHRMREDLDAVARILKDGIMPDELQGDVVAFETLLWKLAGEKKT
ncbi:putative aldo-keto reductase [Xylariomycetidae sp. FL0641]|nr:putative aldo-keto reductase [Xylariomycetidae sp. FL0641]